MIARNLQSTTVLVQAVGTTDRVAPVAQLQLALGVAPGAAGGGLFASHGAARVRLFASHMLCRYTAPSASRAGRAAGMEQRGEAKAWLACLLSSASPTLRRRSRRRCAAEHGQVLMGPWCG